MRSSYMHGRKCTSRFGVMVFVAVSYVCLPASVLAEPVAVAGGAVRDQDASRLHELSELQAKHQKFISRGVRPLGPSLTTLGAVAILGAALPTAIWAVGIANRRCEPNIWFGCVDHAVDSFLAGLLSVAVGLVSATVLGVGIALWTMDSRRAKRARRKLPGIRHEIQRLELRLGGAPLFDSRVGGASGGVVNLSGRF